MDRLSSSDMETIICSGDESHGQMQWDDTAQLKVNGVTRILQALHLALLDARRKNQELKAENAALKEHRVREEELEKELAVMKITMKQKVEENLSLTTELHLQHLENQKVDNEWKEKCAALQENYEEKLRCSVLEEEASFQKREDLLNKLRKTEKWFLEEAKEVQALMLKNIELQNLTSKTDWDNVKVKTEKKEKKEHLERERKESKELKKREKKEKKETIKQEKKEQLEREKKESKELKKREKKEQLEREKEEKEEGGSVKRSKWSPCFLF
ncbi:DNA ligase 1-like [Platichthys flesus]|uniref:DNA ligase 1-like n=1 Tax=Platichthys flesus TaxID=8260 RepID=UPI002DBEF9F4|nr:DNA ligase 1-like [Platichthys flesus]